MKQWWSAYQTLWKKRGFRVTAVLSAVFSYGYLITHHTIGIDDTPFQTYFQEGLSAVVGRWFFFMLNKIVHVWELAPFLTDLAGVLLLVAGAGVWTLLVYRIFGERIADWGYGIFAGLIISNPLHSEVFPYFLHNGVGCGYLFCGIALCFFWEWNQKSIKVRIKGFCPLFASVLFLWMAIGCYESFMIVYLVGICLLLCSERVLFEHPSQKSFRLLFQKILCAGGCAFVALILRSLMVTVVVAVFGLDGLTDIAPQRSIIEVLEWMKEPLVIAEFGMVVKRLFMMYIAFGYAYLPIAVYVSALFFMTIFALWKSIRKKDGWILALFVSSFAVSYLLAIVEGKATYYRSAQFLPIVCAFGGLWIVYAVSQLRITFMKREGIYSRLITGILCVSFAALLWNQCADMNKWFYVDDLKYQEAKNSMLSVAYELEKNFTTDKPILFTGDYVIPKSIIEDAYVQYGTKTFYRINRLANLWEPHLLEKFYRPEGVWIAQTPSLSVIGWGKTAFGSTAELVRFFALHGYEIKVMENTSLLLEEEQYAIQLPSFPKEGSIVDRGDYILVHW